MTRHLTAAVALSLAALAGAPARTAAQATPAPQGTPSAGVSYTKAQLDSMLNAAASARKQTVAANMNLTDAEAKAFWPLYDDYRAAINKIRMQEWNSLHKMMLSPDSITDKQIKTMTSSWVNLRVKEQQTSAAWLPKFAKVLPPRKVARYFQIEHRLDLLVQMAVAQEIPLVN